MNRKFESLYSRDVKGNILEWRIEVQRRGNEVDLFIAYGQYGKEHTVRYQRNIKSKNIGKANETSAWEQAVSMAKSKINRKIKLGYITLDKAKEIYTEPEIGTKIDLNIVPITEPENPDTFKKELEKYIPKITLDANHKVKPMKANPYFRARKKPYTDKNGKTWSDIKYYYISNPHVEKDPKASSAKFPMIGQPKINGVRAFISKDGITSKNGDAYKISHLNKYIKNTPELFNYEGQELILDGELYIHGESLQDIGSAVDKTNLNTPRIVFVLFDLAIPNTSNIDRWNIIKSYIKPILDETMELSIQIISSTVIKNDKHAQNYTDYCISKGYEGIILRSFEDDYHFGKRRNNMLKLKRSIDEEFKIVDIIPQEKDPNKGNFLCVTKEGERFSVNPTGTDDYKRDLLENKDYYIGKNLTLKFYEWTNAKKPLHVMDATVRDYE